MPHPKKRKTKAGRNQRRSHHALEKAVLTKCEKCQKPVRPHYACSSCGYYKKNKVIDVLKKLSKKDRKKVEKVNKKEETKKTKQEEKKIKEETKKTTEKPENNIEKQFNNTTI